MDEAAKALLAQGILGIVVLALAWWILRKEREAVAERERHALDLEKAREACDAEKAALRELFVAEQKARITDAQGYAGLSLTLQRDVLTYVQDAKQKDEKVAEKLGEMVDTISKNTAATERLTAEMMRGRP